MPSSQYLECELYLTGYDQARLSVAGREYSGRPALDEALQRRLVQAALDPAQYGTYLFEALFRGDRDDLLAGYREAMAIAGHEERRLRFRLHIATTAPAELHDLHWEFLYDDKKKVALGRSRKTAFSRYLSTGDPPATAIDGSPRLLVVLSTPCDLADYSLAELDREKIHQSLSRSLSSLGNTMDYEFLDGPATLSRICDRLVEGEFHMLLLQAHGHLDPERHIANLVLETDDGNADFVDEARFAEIFAGETALRLVTLLACHGAAQNKEDPFSGLGPALLERGIPAVVAMRQKISIGTASLFAEHFLRNLTRTGHVDAAINEARLQLHLAGHDDPEWGTPALFTRLADGLLCQPVRNRRKRSDTEPREATETPWKVIPPWIRTDNLIPILGPGINRGLLPSGKEIAHIWAAEHGYPLNRRPNLPRLAQYLEKNVSRGFPHQALPDLLTWDLLEREQIKGKKSLMNQGLSGVIEKIAYRYFDRDENAPHRILAELPISTYMTTNYDAFMTAALRWKGRTPVRKACAWKKLPVSLSADDKYDDLEGTRDNPLVFHLYGNDLDPTSQVLTEDDYLDFLGAIAKDFRAKVPTNLRGKLSESMLLFLGYNINDLDCRVLFRGLIKQLKESPRERLAVLQLEGAEADGKKRAEVERFMKKTCENLDITVYWGSVREFLIELHDRLQRIP